MTTFHKSATARAIAFEVAGLRDLQAAADAGGAPCAQLVDSGDTWLETARLDEGRVTPDAAREFGAALARTHAHCPEGARVFGQAPSTFADTWNLSGYMGKAGLPLVSTESEPRSFGEFYGQDRLLPYLELAIDNGSIDSAGAQVIESLAERLRDGVFDSPQPSLVTTDAALLHGDLWSGNVLWAHNSSGDRAGSGVVGTLIDPASHGGHAESDLAQLTVFGQRHVDEIYAGYDEESPLADGWRERIGLHTLHILIVHAALFGGSYGNQTVRTARAYL